MGKMTLSKLQKAQYKEIVRLFNNKNAITLENTDYIRMRETLAILEALGYIQEIKIDNSNMFQKLGSFSDFDKWHKDKEREERKLTLREWKIGIVGALIGLIPFIVATVKPWVETIVIPFIETTVIPWIVSLFEK